MAELKAAKDAVEKEVLSEHMGFICADNAFVKKPKNWDLKNIHKGGYD